MGVPNSLATLSHLSLPLPTIAINHRNVVRTALPRIPVPPSAPPPRKAAHIFSASYVEALQGYI